MDAILNLLTPKTVDTILSDPLLMVGACLVVLGVFLFLFSFIKFIRYGKNHEAFVVPHHPIDEEIQPQSTVSLANGGGKGSFSPLTPLEPPPVQDEPEPEPTPQERYASKSDETMVMAPGVSELQAQFEIAITQIKQLNRKVFELERQFDGVQSRSQTNLEPNELKEPPMDAADFTKKLLKVVEHVILLEKEVANLKAQKEQSAATPPVQIEPLRIETPQEETSSSSNPPVMPV